METKVVMNLTQDEAMADIVAAIKTAGKKEPPEGYYTLDDIVRAAGITERWAHGKIKAAMTAGTIERYPERIGGRWYYRAVKR